MSTGHRSGASLTSGTARHATPQDEEPVRFHPPTNPLAVALRGYQNALDEWDESVADLLGVNRTDLRCIDLLSMSQPMTAGELARAAGLSSGAMTFVLDRLERAGMLARRRDEQDRRRVFVELLPEAAQRALAIHMPLIRAMRSRLSSFSADDLAAITRFFAIGSELYRAQASRLRTSVATHAHQPGR